MKFLLAAALLSGTPAFAANWQDHTCDKAALEIVTSIFGNSRVRAVHSVIVDAVIGGSNHEDIKISIRGDVSGFVVMTTSGEGDSDSCNIKKIYLK